MEQGMQSGLNGVFDDSNMTSQSDASSTFSTTTQSNVNATPLRPYQLNFEIQFAPGTINPNQVMHTPGRTPQLILAHEQRMSSSAILNSHSRMAFREQSRRPQQCYNIHGNGGSFTSHGLDASPFRPAAIIRTLQSPGTPGMTSEGVGDEACKGQSMEEESETTPTKQKSPSPRRKLKEKNRIAARKCRGKKKLESINLARKAVELERENEHLKAEVQIILEERDRFRYMLSLHERCDAPEIQQFIAAQITQRPLQNQGPAYAHMSPSNYVALWNRNNSIQAINYSRGQNLQQAHQQFVVAQHGFVPQPQPTAPLSFQSQNTQGLPDAGPIVESPTDSAIEMDRERKASNQSACGRMGQHGVTSVQDFKPLLKSNTLNEVEGTEDQEFAF